MNTLTLHKKDYFEHQWSFLKSNKPIVGLIGGMGCGKTYSFLHRTFINHVTKKNAKGKSNGWIIYPTYDLAEELFVDPFKEILESKGIDYEYNIAKHRFITAYGRIKLYQLQKPQRIIGAELTYIGFDEFDVESYKNCDIAFKKAVGRMRGSEDCQIYIVSTPEGFAYCYKIFVEDDNDDRFVVHGKTTDNTTLPVGYLNLLASSYDKELLKAYRDGEFCNLSAGSTYYMFKRELKTQENPDGNLKKVSYDNKKPIHFGLDFNVDPMCGVLCQINDFGPKVQVFDTIKLSHNGKEILTETVINTLKNKYPKARLICYPDAAGGARHTSALYSDIELIRRSGIEVRVKPRNPSVIARVNSVNKLLEQNLIIDPSCKDLIEDLSKVCNIQGTREIDKRNKDRSHMTDALGYFCEYNFPVAKPNIGAFNRYGGKA